MTRKKTHDMDYISQRHALRRPLKYDAFSCRLNNHIANLDGGCDTWRRYLERRVAAPLRKTTYRREEEQFQVTVDKQAMAKSMWQKRLNGTTEGERCEYWWLKKRDVGKNSSSTVNNWDFIDEDIGFVGENGEGDRWDHGQEDLLSILFPLPRTAVSVAGDNAGLVVARVGSGGGSGDDDVVMSDDENEDEDDNGTMYSRALPNHPSTCQAPPNQVSIDNILSETSIGVDSHISNPYMVDVEVQDSIPTMFDVDMCESHPPASATEMHDSTSVICADENQTLNMHEISPWTEPSQEMPARDSNKHQVRFKTLLDQYVRQAWSQYEDERRLDAVDKNRTLRVFELRGETLPICPWKRIPCWQDYKAYEASAINRPRTGRCAYERAPMILLTTEDGRFFELQEVKNILSEAEIAEIRRERDSMHEQAQQEHELYDLLGLAASEGQTHAESRASDAAKAWWAAKQRQRDATYIDWEHAEAQELALTKRQIEREVEQYMAEQEIAEAREDMLSGYAAAQEAQVEHLASLKLKLEREELDNVDAGRYVGRNYDVNFDSRMLATFVEREDDVNVMSFVLQLDADAKIARAIRDVEEEEDKKKKRLKQKVATWDKLMKVCERRDKEISKRYTHRKGVGGIVKPCSQSRKLFSTWFYDNGGLGR